MMDIVELMRVGRVCDDKCRVMETRSGCLCAEAADEITRLRNELHIAQEWSSQVIAGREQDIAEITALRADNERLRAALRGMIDNACAACDEDYVIRATKKEWDAHVNATAKARAALEGKP